MQSYNLFHLTFNRLTLKLPEVINFSLQYRYTIQPTGNKNIPTYQLKFVVLI